MTGPFGVIEPLGPKLTVILYGKAPQALGAVAALALDQLEEPLLLVALTV
jgi:hypothetical protein